MPDNKSDARAETKNVQLMSFDGTNWDRVRCGLSGVLTSIVGVLNTLPLGKYNATPPTLTDGKATELQLTAAGQLITSAPALEALINDNRFLVENRNTSDSVTAEGQISDQPGYLKSIIISQDVAGAPTAGLLTIYDSLTEEGDVIFKHYIPNTAIATPIVIDFNRGLSTGLFVGFDATLAGVRVTAIYR